MSDINIEDCTNNVSDNNSIQDNNVEDSINVILHNINTPVINIADSTEDNQHPVLQVNDTVTDIIHTSVTSPLGTRTTRSSVRNDVPAVVVNTTEKVSVVTTENTTNKKDKQSFPTELTTFSFENRKSLVCTNEPDPSAPNNSVEVAPKLFLKTIMG
jgi:hypothetical protein